MKNILLSIILIFCFIQDFKCEKIKILMIGDSTMANKNIDNENQERGWGQMLHMHLTDDIIVDNHAKNGRSSKSFITEGRWNEVFKSINPGDFVFIQFGHNDEKSDPLLYTAPGSTFDDNLIFYIEETRKKGGIPVLFNSIVRRNFPTEKNMQHKGHYVTEGDILVDTHGEYVKTPFYVASRMNVPFIDMNRLTHDLICSMGMEESKKLFMWIPKDTFKFCPKGKIDNTHLNIHGATIISKIAIEAASKEIPELKAYLKSE